MEQIEEVKIYWDKENPNKLDVEYYEDIRMVMRFTGLIVVLSALGAIAYTIAAPSLYSKVAMIVYGSLLVLNYIRMCSVLVYRKPNAVFHARALLYVILISYALEFIQLFLFAPFVGFDSFYRAAFRVVLASLGCYCLYKTYKGEDFQLVYPKEFRKHSVWDWIAPIALFVLLL